MTHKLCTFCEITLNYPSTRFPKIFEFKSVSNTSSNDVLVQILKFKKKFKPNLSFIIFVDNSRYGIKIISLSPLSVLLEQHFLHYDSIKMSLVSVFKRLVRIRL